MNTQKGPTPLAKGERMTTLGVIEVADRTKPGRSLGGRPILEWVVRNATECERLDAVVVLASDHRSTQELSRLVPADVPVFRSYASDAMGRMIDVVERFQPQGVVRLAADAPFVDPVLVDRLVNTADEHPNCDYITYCLRDGRPGILSPVGLFAEWCCADALRKASRLARQPAEREQPLRYLFTHPEFFQVRLVPAPERLDRQDMRLTVGSEEDLANAQTIVEALGPDRLEWHRIAELLEGQPALRKRMAMLNLSGD